MVDTVLDLREHIVTSDFGASLRAGSLALRSALDAVNSRTAGACATTIRVHVFTNRIEIQGDIHTQVLISQVRKNLLAYRL